MRKLIVTLGLVAALGVAAPAQAAPANITLDNQAAWSAGRINLGFTATCTGGTGTVTVRVSQTSPAPAGGIGSTPVVCDGQPHTGAVTVLGGFQPGTATAQASLTAPGGGDLDSRTIKIV